jgi:HEAT repeat protein
LVLARFGCTEALPEIVELTKRAPTNIRVALIKALELFGKPAAIDILVELLERRGARQTNPVLSAMIHCGKDAPERLSSHLNHRLPWVRTVIGGALGEVATPDQVPALLGAIYDPVPEVRAKIARALGRTGDVRAVGGLGKLAADPIWYVRLRAIAALDQLRSPETVHQFWQSIHDTNWIVREKAAKALYTCFGDPVSLLRRVREEIGDRYVVGALVSVLEREGVTWKAIDSLCSPRAEEREESQMLAAELLRLGEFSSALHALEAPHPDRCVRREVSRLIKKYAQPSVRASLERLLSSPALHKAAQKDLSRLLTELET